MDRAYLYDAVYLGFNSSKEIVVMLQYGAFPLYIQPIRLSIGELLINE